eukprot:1392713-Rhodomonas_salina.2
MLIRSSVRCSQLQNPRSPHSEPVLTSIRDSGEMPRVSKLRARLRLSRCGMLGLADTMQTVSQYPC